MKHVLFMIATIAIVFVGCKKEEVGGEEWPSTSVPADEIWYTSSDGKIIEPKYENFGDDVTVVSNTYENGIGIIKFNGPVTDLGHSVFKDCETLTRIALPNGLTTIRQWAFENCKNLVSINIPESVRNFGNAFQYCESLTSITIPNGVEKIVSETFWYCTNLSNVNIPNSVTSIGPRAFFYCKSLTDITIPNSVTEIGWNAFFNTNLATVTIPDSVTYIGDNPFEACLNLTAFYGPLSSTDNRCLILDGTLVSFALACGVTEYTIPYGVTSIGYEAFRHCQSLTIITIQDSVKIIEDFAFADCRSLTTVDIPNSVTSIEHSAFCIRNSNLTNVYCRATTPPALADIVFHGYADGEYVLPESLQAIYVPKESVEAYKSAESWSEYIDLIQGYDF